MIHVTLFFAEHKTITHCDFEIKVILIILI